MYEREPLLVLVVEDDADDEKLTLRALQGCGVPCIIDVVRDGVEALEYLASTGRYAGRTSPRLPALVILDLKLPKANGLEVLKQVRGDAKFHGMPIVVMTSSDEESDITNSYRLGANSYIRKPVEFDVFTDAIRQLANYWLTLNIGRVSASHALIST